jgi:rubrerythrin
MISNLPIIIDGVGPGDADRDVLRAAIITALDTLRCYQEMAYMAGDERIRKILLEGAREEGGRVQELGTILLGEGEDTGTYEGTRKE